jgi:hypothetical protein
MTNNFQFGLGPGHLNRAAKLAAAKLGATLHNHTDPQCSCGHGCTAGTCKRSQRHWFSAPNYGEPHNSRLADAVLDALKAQRG